MDPTREDGARGGAHRRPAARCRGTLGGRGTDRRQARPQRAADRRAQATRLHRDRRAQGQGAAALRGQGTGRCAQRRHRADRRHGLRRAQQLRRPGRHADAGQAGPRRPALQQLPHHRGVLADARGAEVRPQPSHGEHGLHHRDGDRLPGRDRPGSGCRRAARGNAAPERLQHGGLRQVARDRVLGDQRLGAVRPLADAAGLRQVLRLLRRRDQPVGAADLRRRHAWSNCRTTRTTTS